MQDLQQVVAALRVVEPQGLAPELALEVPERVPGQVLEQVREPGRQALVQQALVQQALVQQALVQRERAQQLPELLEQEQQVLALRRRLEQRKQRHKPQRAL